MEAVFLSRIQFALSVGFHFIFPSLTLGLTFIIGIFETIFYKNGNEIYKQISDFLIKILGLVFTLGVATGIVLEFSFGTNWAEYSKIVGDIFGAPLAAEAVFAFFLESVFMGILLFGRKRVSKRTFLISSYLVIFGSHLSAFWILAANSWMQTPAGFTVAGGRAVLESFSQAVLNPSTVIRLVHVVLSSWIAGSLFCAGIGAWYILKVRHIKLAKPLLKISVIIFVSCSIIMLFSGHLHSIQVAKTQPAKMASFEALWKTQKCAPMSIIGIPDKECETTYFDVSIPKLLSILIYFDPNHEVQGLNNFKKSDWPPILPSFAFYHIMIGLGMIFILMAFIYGYLLIFKKLFCKRFFLWVLLFSVPLPHVAIQIGWMAAEVGRQPWVVYNVLRTSDAVSKVVPAEQILIHLYNFQFNLCNAFLFVYIHSCQNNTKGPNKK